MIDRSGNVLPMAAVGLLMTAAVVGSAVDLSRAYRTKGSLQSACDAAVLAGRKAVSSEGFDETAEQRADEYFVANFDTDSHGGRNVTFTASSDDNGYTVQGVANATIDTTLMSIFGKSSFALSASCQASLGVGNSDVVMVLDTTGSMGRTLSGTSQTRLAALQAAMMNFYDTLDATTRTTNARIRYGFVPYSSSVNVGRLLLDLNPDFLADAHVYQSRIATWETVVEQTVSGWEDPVTTTSSNYGNTTYSDWEVYSDTRYRSESDCEDELPDETDWEDYGSPTTNTNTYTNSNDQQVTQVTVSQRERRKDYACWRYSRNRYYIIERWYYRTQNEVSTTIRDPIYTETEGARFDGWEYRPVEYDTSVFKTFLPTTTMTSGGNSGPPSAQTSTWTGCIEERQTVATASISYSTLFGITPSGATDLNIDAAPWSTETRWAPMWPDISYAREDDRGRWTIATTDDGERINGACPVQAQLLSEMDQDAFETYANSLQAQGNTYLDLGLLWGARLSSPEGIFSANVTDDPSNGGETSRHIIFMTDGIMEPNNGIVSSYGIEWFDRRITDNGSTDHAARHTARFLAICRAIKAKGIRLWVIAFTSGLSTDLTTCASDASAFTANNADELDDAFQEIATAVGELRVTR